MTALKNKSAAAKSSKKARSTAARLAAVQAVYQQHGNDAQDAASVIAEYIEWRLGAPLDGEEMVLPDGALFTKIVEGVEARQADLKEVIGSHLTRDDANVDTIDPLLRALLLCGGYELMAHHEIDAPIIIADYLHATHAFYDQGEEKLVNAVLDKVGKALRDE